MPTTATAPRTRDDAVRSLIALGVAMGAGRPIDIENVGDGVYLTYRDVEKASLIVTIAEQIRDDFRSPMIGSVEAHGGIVRIELRNPATW